MAISELLAGNIRQTKGMINSFLKDFSDEDMFFRPVKGANNATWQIGHLANSTRGMVCGCDQTVAFPFEDDSRFGKSKAQIDDSSFFPKKKEILDRFDAAMEVAADWVAKLREADLAKPSPERLRHFAPTFGNVALLLASHPTLHIGQFSVMRRALGKPHVM